MTYDARDFVIRNMDSLHKDLSQAMYHCDHPLLKVLFPEGKNIMRIEIGGKLSVEWQICLSLLSSYFHDGYVRNRNLALGPSVTLPLCS